MALDYEKRLQLYREEYEVSGFENYSDQTKFISLVTTIYAAGLKKDPEFKILNILIKLNDNMQAYGNLYQCVSFTCHGLIKQRSKINNYGYTKASEIMAELKRLLDDRWLPF